MNKGRIVDILLIITLVLVAFGITYTLLTLNRGQTRPPPETTPTPVETPLVPADSPVDPLGGGNLPVIPEGLGDAEASGVQPLVPTDPAEAGADDQQTVGADPAEDEPEEAAPPRTLVAGEVQLESVGFSFVTGGAGACGVTLEAWQHVAVSRDLLADLGCGAPVTIELADETGGNTLVNAVIGDTMNPAHSMTVNIYVGQNEPALEYGRTSGILSAD